MARYEEVDPAHDKRVRRIFYLALFFMLVALITWIGAVWVESGKLGVTGVIIFLPSAITMFCCALSLRWIE